MAKRKDSVSPDELLETIRGGALKTEVIKKYRTSEQELARLLLPLYKSGDLSKEEFNDFFKGVPLRPRETPSKVEEQEAAQRAVQDEPPSEIVKSLAKASEPEPAEARPPEPEKAVLEEEVKEEVVEAAEPALGLAEPEVAQEPVVVEQPLELPAIEELALEEPLVEEPPAAEEFEAEKPPEEEPVAEELPVEEPEVEEPTEKDQDVPEVVPVEPLAPADSAGVSSMLEMIFSKLSSIENRIAAIEKKLDRTDY